MICKNCGVVDGDAFYHGYVIVRAVLLPDDITEHAFCSYNCMIGWYA
jgi:hypothetical protein